MPEISWAYPFLPKVLEEIPQDTRTLIDIGCGRGIIGALMRIYRQSTRLVGIDIFQPYLKFCKEFNLYDEVYRLDLGKLPLPFKDKAFDVATCIEVIEHLPKEHGQKLLDELERCSKLVIVTTPPTFFSQPELDENPHQRHICSWTVADFRNRGYAVQGHGGFLIWRKRIKYISSFLAPLCKKWFPQFALSILAKKWTYDTTPDYQ